MLAGVGAVEVALLVVAANEGWMPQTEEHVADPRAPRRPAGAGRGDQGRSRRRRDPRARRTGAGRPPRGDAAGDLARRRRRRVSGRGLDELRAALDAVLASAPDPRDAGRPRLWIDRVFAARGCRHRRHRHAHRRCARASTRKSSWSRARAPVASVASSRTREQLERVGPGNRVALNLAGVDHDAIRRGDAVVRPGQWVTPTTVDVVVRATADHEFPRRGPVDAHVGSGEQTPRSASSTATSRPRGAFGRLQLPVGAPARARRSGRAALVGAPRDDRWRRGARRGADPPDRGCARAGSHSPSPSASSRPARGATATELGPLAGVADGDAWARAPCAEGRATNTGGWIVSPAARNRCGNGPSRRSPTRPIPWVSISLRSLRSAASTRRSCGPRWRASRGS